MPSFRTALAAALLLGSGGAALAAETARPDGDALALNAVQIGPATGDPEQDSVGWLRDAGGECGLGPLFSRDVVLHGAPMGDPEKESLGHRVTGQGGCPDAVR